MKVWVYEEGKPEERRFASEDEAQKWFAENDPEGVAFAMSDIPALARAILDHPLDGDSVEPNTLRHIIESFYTGPTQPEAPQSAKDEAERIAQKIVAVAIASIGR